MMVFTSPWLMDKFLTVSFRRLFYLSRFYFDKWRWLNLQIPCEYLSRQNKHVLIMFHLIQFLCTCTCMTYDLCTRKTPFILILFKKYITQGLYNTLILQNIYKEKKRRKRQSGVRTSFCVFIPKVSNADTYPSATILTTFMVLSFT